MSHSKNKCSPDLHWILPYIVLTYSISQHYRKECKSAYSINSKGNIPCFSSSTSALDTSGYSSPAESSDELDKAYWIRRAGEVGVVIRMYLFLSAPHSYHFSYRRAVSIGQVKSVSSLSYYRTTQIMNDIFFNSICLCFPLKTFSSILYSREQLWGESY